MRLAELQSYFETSPAVRLLRSRSAPLVIEFLHRQFKGEQSRISIPSPDLLAALSEYIESVRERGDEGLQDSPEQYLSAWSSGDTRWLQRTLETSHKEPIYQLTSHTEDVLLFVEKALRKDLSFVGTESRLRLVISTLADLVGGASRNPEVRLSHLREERQRVDDEIQAIMTNGGVTPRYEPSAVRERFAAAVSMLRELMSDFRAVEDRFKDITRQVQRRQLDGQESRGNILQFAMDAEDVLKSDDQGVSFYEFVRFILSPNQQDKLQAIIGELAQLDELSQQAEGMSTVRRMVPTLIAEAEKVMRTNQRLSSTLRRLLDHRTLNDRRRIAQLLAEIRKARAIYREYQRAWLRYEADFFPRSIPASLRPSSDIVATANQVRQLRAEAKETVGYGYTVQWREIRSRTHGTNQFPERIVIETEDDLLRLCGGRSDFARFTDVAQRVRTRLPELEPWLASHPSELSGLSEQVEGLIEVVEYLRQHPRPGCFARELPLSVDTKFVERNQGVLGQWLDRVLPSDAIRADQEHFGRRFGLNYSEPDVLVRFLNSALQRELGFPCQQLSLPLSVLRGWTTVPPRVVIVENKVNLLTLPTVPGTVGIGGLGAGVTLLQQVEWLDRTELVYWGDVDVEGFLILASIRSRFPNLTSRFMDWPTLDRYRSLTTIGTGRAAPADLTTILSESEVTALRECVSANLRLEQERIPHRDVLASFTELS